MSCVRVRVHCPRSPCADLPDAVRAAAPAAVQQRVQAQPAQAQQHHGQAQGGARGLGRRHAGRWRRQGHAGQRRVTGASVGGALPWPCHASTSWARCVSVWVGHVCGFGVPCVGVQDDDTGLTPKQKLQRKRQQEIQRREMELQIANIDLQRERGVAAQRKQVSPSFLRRGPRALQLSRGTLGKASQSAHVCARRASSYPQPCAQANIIGSNALGLPGSSTPSKATGRGGLGGDASDQLVGTSSGSRLSTPPTGAGSSACTSPHAEFIIRQSAAHGMAVNQVRVRTRRSVVVSCAQAAATRGAAATRAASGWRTAWSIWARLSWAPCRRARRSQRATAAPCPALPCAPPPQQPPPAEEERAEEGEGAAAAWRR